MTLLLIFGIIIGIGVIEGIVGSVYIFLSSWKIQRDINIIDTEFNKIQLHFNNLK